MQRIPFGTNLVRIFSPFAKAVWLLLCLCVLSVEPAFGHASLIGSNPQDGAVVQNAPGVFSITFNEPVTPITLKLVRPDGTVSLLSDYKLDDQILTITSPGKLDNGSYALSYRVISADGHPVGGTIVFAVGAPSTSKLAATVDDTPQTTRLVIIIDRILIYTGLFLGVGGAFAIAWLGQAGQATISITRAFLGVGLVATVAALGLQGLDVLAVSPGNLLQMAPWRAGYGTSYALTVGLASAAIVLGLIALADRQHPGRATSLAALQLVGFALAASGHASDAEPHWLTKPAVFLHAIMIAFWVGALPPLLLALSNGNVGASRFLVRFSKSIPYAVAILVTSGAILAFIQVREPGALLTTDYGRIMLIKLILLAVLFLLALINRVKLTRPALEAMQEGTVFLSEGQQDRAGRHLRRSVLAEILLVLAIFVAVANWRFTPPPRVLIEAAKQPISIHLHSDKVMAELTIIPGSVGPVSMIVEPMANGSDELTIREIIVAFSNPAAGIEPIRRKAVLTEAREWVVNDLSIPIAGQWTVRVDILISEFEMASLEGTVRIAP